jgi:hypothetical protein
MFASGEDRDESIAEWTDRIRSVLAWKPFSIELHSIQSLRAAVRKIIEQATLREVVSGGYASVVLQHLVGATLECSLGREGVRHGTFSFMSASKGRIGHFFIDSLVIHVTASPGELIIERCRQDLADGHRPILVTLQRGLSVAEGLAANVGLSERIDMFEIEQFVALNLYEVAKFAAEGRKTAVTDLVSRYNEIVDEFETDPSLKIELRR